MRDHNRLERLKIAAGSKKEERNYWHEKLSGELFTQGFPAAPDTGGRVDVVTFNLEGRLYNNLRHFSTGSDVRLFIAMASMLTLLLAKYTGSDDIVLGTPIYKPKYKGELVNTVCCLRNTLQPEMTLKELLIMVRQSVVEADKYRNYPLDILTQELGQESLFETAVLLENIHDSRYLQDVAPAVTFSFFSDDSSIQGKIRYATSRYHDAYMEQVGRHFTNLVEVLLNDPGKKIANIGVLSKKEKQWLLVDFNSTGAEYPLGKTAIQLFEEQAAAFPGEPAASEAGSDRGMVYGELNARANQLARLLRNRGIGSDSIVGIMMDHSQLMLIGIVGILKAGGAYLPINPSAPKGRVEYILKDSAIPVLLTSKESADGIEFEGKILDISEQRDTREENGNPVYDYKPGDIAYIIYTSGSTGRPKGVAVEHKQLVNFLYHMYNRFDGKIDKTDRCLSLTNMMFDVSVWEYFLPLCFGAALVMLAEEKRFDVSALSAAILDEQITLVYLPPGLLEGVYRELSVQHRRVRLKKMLVGVEPIRDETLEAYMQLNPDMEIINGYGPTETTICCTTYNYQSHESSGEIVPIGAPLSNNRVVLLDAYGNMVPKGVPGELCVSGAGVSRGYLNNPELTAEKFFDFDWLHGTHRTYNTGDLVKLLPDGNLRFIGRRDQQHKIRGYRVELGEIEHRLLKRPEIKQALVLAKKHKRIGKYLCAYFISEMELDIDDLREQLLADLPDYMIPSYFIRLDQVPLTPNGKVNMNALPEPQVGTGSVVYAAPRNPTETKMVQIWAEILDLELDCIGIDDNFFELGGHSLTATRLISEIFKTFDVNIPLEAVFKKPTIKILAGMITDAGKSVYTSIEPVEKKEYYLLTPQQERLYILQQMEPDSTGYNMPHVLALKETVDPGGLERALAMLIRRHESFRTSFRTLNGCPVQIVHDTVDFSIEHFDLSTENVEVTESIQNSFVRAFELSQAPLLRAALIRTGDQGGLLMLDLHHIITDGTSQGLLTGEFMALYAGKDLPEPGLHYKDYAQWLNRHLRTETIVQQDAFWLKTLSGDLPVLNLPMDCKRPEFQSFEGSRLRFVLNKQVTEGLKQLGQDAGATLYMTLLSVFTILLSKMGGDEDVIIGTPIAGRRHPDTLNLIGMLVNTLAMRNFPGGDKPVSVFLGEVKENTIRAFENQECQFDRLVEKLSVPRDTGRNPLFDVLFNLLNQAEYDGRFSLFEADGENQYENVTSKFDLNLTAVERKEQLVFDLEYCTKLFKRETIESFIRYFKRIAEAVAANPSQRLAELELLSWDEKQAVLERSQGPGAEHDDQLTVYQMFEDTAARYPGNIALVMGDRRIDYDELNRRSNSLARVLRSNGVTAGTMVGLMVERSTEMVIGILAALKAGGACLPIDIAYPEERKQYMVENSGVKQILVNRDSQEFKQWLPREVEMTDLRDESLYGCDNENIEHITGGHDLVYVIYTSGSTGRPKGVMLEHRNLVNLIRYQYSHTVIDFSSVLQFTTISFDVSFQEIFSTLLAGGQLHLISREIRNNIPGLFRVVRENDIKTLFLAAGFLKFVFTVDEYINAFPTGIDHLVTAGEQIVVNDRFRDYLAANRVCLHNHYGPSETHVVTVLTLKPGDEIPRLPSIGRPVMNTGIYILDKYGNVLPEGATGELVIGGVQVGRGYLNRPELSAKRFIDFNWTHKSCLTYKTGDLARWLPDGSLEFMGRIDHQVKIRGFRIELGEIENRLVEMDNIKESLVLARETEQGEKYLCAYIVSHSFDTGELRDYLSRKLPDYMIPAFFVQLEEIPLTPNGKIDRKALPVPVVTGDDQTVNPPRDQLEKILVEIWAEVLGVEQAGIGIDDNFFHLGGHSLKATIMVSRVHKELGVKLRLAVVFKHPNIRQLASLVKASGNENGAIFQALEKKEYYPVSSAQNRLYLLQQMVNMTRNYNLPTVFQLDGNLDEGLIESAFGALIRRHESLRTSFHMLNDRPVQRVRDHVSFSVEKYGSINPNGAIKDIISKFIRPFDLAQAPLFNAGLIEIDANKHLLMVDMHHIISDGVSIGLMVKEFMTFYEGKELPALKLHYKEYADWQWKEQEKESLKLQEAFWLNALCGEIPILNLPYDYVRPDAQAFSGKAHAFVIGPDETGALIKWAANEGATLFMVLLSIFYILLAKLSGQEDIIVGTPIAGRNQNDLQQIVGMFVNTLVMRNFPAGEHSLRDFLGKVKENTLSAFENQDYPYETLVEKVVVQRDAGRNPLFDTMFSLQNFDIPEFEIPGLRLTPYHFERDTAKFDLVLDCTEKDGTLFCNFEYSTQLFKEETIGRFSGYMNQLVAVVLQQPGKKISELEMITEDEKIQLLIHFNDNYTDYPREKTIHELFEAEVDKEPGRTVIVCRCDKSGIIHISYEELNRRACRLAYKLLSDGAGPETIVALKVERSPEMIIGILGILKAGGAYLPVPLDYPRERIDYMLNDSNSQILLTAEEILTAVSDPHKIRPAVGKAGPGNIAYVIYTSGSTGKPKGVLITHANVVRIVKDTNYMEIAGNDRLLQLSNFAFDGSVFDIYGALTNGSTLVLADRGKGIAIDRLASWIILQQVSVFLVTTALFNTLVDLRVDCFKDVRRVLFGGERVSVEHSRKALANLGKQRIVHVYGPTETTVFATYYYVDQILENAITIPIGSPISNTEVYILDKYNQIAPLGVSGELHIGGDGMARGYLNRPELTSEQFVHLSLNNQHLILYKTGDLARWLSDANIEFLGRIDYQVKIRGYRIELGEIEARLLEHGIITESVVIARTRDNGDAILCAYLVTESNTGGAALNKIEIRDFLLKKLPDYMIPAHYILLDKMPLTPNGKIDRKALPDPVPVIESDYNPPANETQIALVSIWAELLGVDEITVGIDNNFFTMGGQSLKAAVLMAKIHRRFSVDISITEVFKRPTIRQLAELIDSSRVGTYVDIEPVEKKTYYPLSSAQKRLFILYLIDKNGTAYNISSAFTIHGPLDTRSLELAFNRLIRRQDSLRTSFSMAAGQPVQVVHDNVEFSIEAIDPRHPQEETLARFIRPFDLAQAPLMRIGLWKTGKESCQLVLDMHHIISDGISMDIFIKEFTALYEGLEPAEMKFQYKDYARWQNNLLASAGLKEQDAYWREQFSGELPVLNLPLDFERPKEQGSDGAVLGFQLGSEETARLKRLAQDNGATPFMVLLALYNVLLMKLSGQVDIVVGIPTSGRRHSSLEYIIGFFVNTLALRSYPGPEKLVIDFIEEVKITSLNAFENQDYQYEELVETVVKDRDLSRNSLFDVMFAMQDIEFQPLELEDLTLIPIELEARSSKFDMTLTVREESECFHYTIAYSTHLFVENTVRRFAQYFERVIMAVLENPHRPIGSIDVVQGEERQQLLYRFNSPDQDYPSEKTIHQLFEEQAVKSNDRCSVVSVQSQLSFGELNRKADRLAFGLQERGVGAGSIVGLMVHSSLEMIVGILGILKAGGAFMPIDPHSPEERIQYMLRDSNAAILLTADDIVSAIHGTRIPEAVSGKAGGINLVYIIYTSGTTGKSKGTLLEHRNLVNYCTWFSHMAMLTHEDRSLLTSSFGFDLGYTTIFPALLSGCQLHVIPKDTYLSPGDLLTYIRDQRITYIKTTPSLFSTLVESPLFRSGIFAGLRLVVMGGEEIKLKDIEAARSIAPQIEVINHYGPTEATIGCVARYINFDQFEIYKQHPTIGSPIHNMKVSILDKWSNPAPIGVPGELCVSGAGVARGYLNRPELTSEKFFFHRFNKSHKTYKTGDLAKWLPDGSIEFLGRIDSQVKIRGYRVELGEIESRLLNHDSVKEAAVIARQSTPGSKYVCAYIVPVRAEATVDWASIKEHLARSLPDYMIPSYYITLERIPLTPNGKLDRRLLPEPDTAGSNGRYSPPRDDLEKTLVKLWEELLNQESVGIDDNFFNIGGHSLSAILLVSRIHKALDIKITLAQVFKTPTIRSMAGQIMSRDRDRFIEIEPGEKKEYYPLSSAQLRLHVLQQLDETGTGYNMPRIFQLTGKLDLQRLENSFTKLVNRHESFRTSFRAVNDRPLQIVHDNVDFSIGYYELPVGDSENGKTVQAAIFKIIKSFIKAFDLSQAPLMRVGVIRQNEHQHILILDTHHSISDGSSMAVFTCDFMSLYAGEELTALKLHYRDFVGWQQNAEYRKGLKLQERYWLSELSGPLPVLELPTDYPRPLVQSFEGQTLDFEIGETETGAIKNYALTNNTTLYMVILAAAYVFLSKLSGQEDIILGAPTAGRRHTDLEPVIGMFINTLALRQFPDGRKTFSQFLEDVTTRTLSAFENQDYPLEELVEKVAVNRDTGRNPLFDVVFILQNMEMSVVEIPGLELTPYEFERGTAKFDVTLVCQERDDALACSFEYGTALFNEDTILRFAGYLKKLIAQIPVNPHITISQLEMLPEDEKRQLLFEFNETAEGYPTETTIYELFEKQVDTIPEQAALEFKDRIVTFRKLDEDANQLAHYLKTGNGLSTGDRVLVSMERSPELIIALMAVMKAGGAYVPLDPHLPQERIRIVLADATIGIVISQQKFTEKFNQLQDDFNLFHTILCMDDPHDKIGRSPVTRPGIKGAENPAYVMYTSGSSGIPKGVLVEHKTIVNTLVWRRNYYDYAPGDVSLQIPPYFFDSSVTDIFTPLLGGARLVLVSEDERVDLSLLKNVLPAKNVTHFIAVPAFYNVMLEEIPGSLRHVKKICCAGEHFPDELIKKHFGKLPHVRIVNEYGPTENSVNTTAYELRPDSPKALIGSPISNVQVTIRDKYLHLCPIGVGGEMCLSGASLARGYLNRPEPTALKFINLTINSRHTRLYKTGDLARWLASGNLEFLGRLDNQVKIRGIRVEVEEIENHLMKREDIKEAVVLARQDSLNGGERYLCAYVVSSNGTPDIDLKRYLADRLPEYMVPSYVMEIDAIPFTATGKIDRNGLPVPESVEETFVTPQTEIEKSVAEVWAGVLGVDMDALSIDADFFRMGGHSLTAATLASRLHKAFDVIVPLAEIFKTPTIRGLANFILHAGAAVYAAIEPVETREYYPLSAAQLRMYVLHQMGGEAIGSAYNMPSVLLLEGNLDTSNFNRTFQELTQRHEGFRTSFHMVDGKPVQIVQNIIDISIEYIDLTVKYSKGTIQPSTFDIINSFIRPFDLARAPLVRVKLVRQSRKRHIFIVDMHHIISDGMSLGILVKDFMAIYEGKALPLPRIQYRDFVSWQEIVFAGAIKQQEDFWINEFADEVTVLELPTDYARPRYQDFSGNSLEFRLDAEATDELKSFAQKERATLFVVLLGVYTIFLSRVCGQDTVTVGTPTAGRPHTDLESIIGMFVNTLALKNRPAGGKTVREFLHEVKEKTLMAFENQYYQYELLVEKAGVNRDTGRNPLFDTMFMLQNMEIPELSIPGLKLGPYECKREIAKFDLTLQAKELETELFFNFNYCTKLFKEDTVRRLSGFFKTALAQVLAKPELRIGTIQLLSEQEKQQILDTFNGQLAALPKTGTIHRLFEKQALKLADHCCVVSDRIQVTYGELNGRADRLAYRLRERGVEAETIVAIKSERCVELIIGILGILKAGGAYLPIAPDTPPAREKYMLADSNAKILLTTNDLTQETAKELESISPTNAVNCSPAIPTHPLIHSPTQLCYIIYTSGSTGRPKGVMVLHGSVVHLVRNHRKIFRETSRSRISQVASISFDAAAFEIWPCLSAGAALCIANDLIRLSPELMMQWLVRLSITISFQPTQMAMQLLELQWPGGTSLKALRAAGDRLAVYPGTSYPFRLYNLYGPTEDTVWTTWMNVPVKSKKSASLLSPPIGRPVPGKHVYITDPGLNLQPVGIAGELCIAGPGLARGYMNLPELTVERFVHVTPHNLHLTLYKTGDRARYLPDGMLEFLGRIDFQVKIRGFRIELGEIESQLMKHPGVKEAVVADKTDGNRKYLCAYYTSSQPETGKITGANLLKTHLEEALPDYMVPVSFVELDHLPLNASGKVDRRKLPEPADGEFVGGGTFQAPVTKTQRAIANIWKDVLGREKIGILDNFFHLGGNSLDLVSVSNKMREKLKMEVPVATLFECPTISGLEQYLSSTKLPGANIDVPVNFVLLNGTPHPQRNIFFVHEVLGDVGAYMAFSQQLGNSFNCWGIEADKLINYAPRNESIESISSKYISQIKQIQSHGPYSLVTWSWGGHLGLEMALQMEQRGDEISFLGFFDCLGPDCAYVKPSPEFTLETEKDFLKGFFTSTGNEVELEVIDDIQQLWIRATEVVACDPMLVAQLRQLLIANALALPDYDHLSGEELMQYLNLNRTHFNASSRYVPSGKIATPVHYFLANQNSERMDSWGDYCEQPLSYHEVVGDHHSILRDKDQIVNFSNLFLDVLSELIKD